ncbi:MAG: Helicase PriA essential for oriC/DnaA-independent DNA replication [uncultured Gemmatimonadaceae bacterium]|uniref:Helicase PriA essential for oriC/DnaA-independent DNA replication n=1 Tax=uncultured Gemmatimonadaceae bacterium TaxID=246130 RepID=A0A6J4LCH8_9BACT|nr:MAG: Helicase PriA essential for oriC/DnaA-independent DNA replication [uncultured Gemmatimonadaceae bacterium]
MPGRRVQRPVTGRVEPDVGSGAAGRPHRRGRHPGPWPRHRHAAAEKSFRTKL